MRSYNILFPPPQVCIFPQQSSIIHISQLSPRDNSSLVDNKRYEYHGKGVKFLHAMIPIYPPKWPHVDKVKKQEESYNLFRCAYKCIDDYASKFLSFRRDLELNGLHYDMRKIRTLFILSLGRDLNTLHNKMMNLPAGWETKDFGHLTMLAHQHPETVKDNRAQNKTQKEIVNQKNEK